MTVDIGGARGGGEVWFALNSAVVALLLHSLRL